MHCVSTGGRGGGFGGGCGGVEGGGRILTPSQVLCNESGSQSVRRTWHL